MTYTFSTIALPLLFGFSLGILFFMAFKDHIVQELPSDDERF